MSAVDEAAQSALLDLDAIERDDPGRNKAPYAFILAGRRIELIDPVEIDWQVLIEMSMNPGTFATAAMKPADRHFFEAREIPTWKLDRLLSEYQEYYGIDTASGKLKG